MFQSAIFNYFIPSHITFYGTKESQFPIKRGLQVIPVPNTLKWPHEKMKLGLSYVPEGRRLFAKLSVKENLELGAYIIKDRNEVLERLEEVFDLFPRLKDRSSQTAETLSGGEQQMLVIARGLMSKPQLIMLDEMSLGLMPSPVEKVMAAIVRINRTGMSVLIVEQMVQEALEISSRGYILQTGKIIRSGDSTQLLSSDDVRKAYMGL